MTSKSGLASSHQTQEVSAVPVLTVYLRTDREGLLQLSGIHKVRGCMPPNSSFLIWTNVAKSVQQNIEMLCKNF